jgi:hypothetical protein
VPPELHWPFADGGKPVSTILRKDYLSVAFLSNGRDIEAKVKRSIGQLNTDLMHQHGWECDTLSKQGCQRLPVVNMC